MFKDYKKLLFTFSNNWLRENFESLPEKACLTSGGRKIECIAITLKINHFSTISEQFTAEELFRFLHRYSSIVIDETYQAGAFVHTFTGTECEIFFNNPKQDLLPKAYDLVFIIRQRISSLFRETFPDFPYSNIVFSIYAGAVVFFTFGTTQRRFSDVIGETLNMTHRLREINKNYGTQVLTTSTYKIETNKYIFRNLDSIRLAGIKDSFDLVEPISIEQSSHAKEAITLFNEGMQIQKQRDWTKAKSLFEETRKILPDDLPSIHMIRICEKFIENPASPEWDGVYSLTS